MSNATNIINNATFGAVATPTKTTFAGNGQLVNSASSLFTSSTYWTPSSTNGWNLDTTAHTYTHTAGNTTAAVLSNSALSVAPIVGMTYNVWINVSSTSAGGTLTISFAGSSSSAHTLSVSTSITSVNFQFVCTTQDPLTLTPSSAWTGVITAVYITQFSTFIGGDLSVRGNMQCYNSYLNNYNHSPDNVAKITLGDGSFNTMISAYNNDNTVNSMALAFSTPIDNADQKIQMIITAGGSDGTSSKVGINTIAPTEKLDVVGNVKSSGNYILSRTANGLPIGLNMYQSSNLYGEIGIAAATDQYFTGAANTDLCIRNYSGSSIWLGISNGAATINVQNGKVGIAKSAGTQALDVNGSIQYSGTLMAPNATALTGLGLTDGTSAFTMDANTSNTYGNIQLFGRWILLQLKATWTSKNSATGAVYIISNQFPTFTTHSTLATQCSTSKSKVTVITAVGTASIYLYYENQALSPTIGNIQATDLPSTGTIFVSGIIYN